MKSQKSIDIVTPCYNEKDCISLFYEEVSCVVSPFDNYSITIIFVDDGSKDGTLNEIKKLVSLNEQIKVKYISFSRNFGKEAAIYAGLKASAGDLVVLMDSDLQHPPAMLPEMIEAVEEGYDSCAAYRKERIGESILRTLFSKSFYKLFNLISNTKIDEGATDYRLMTRKMVDAVISLSETERFTKGLFQWVGFKTKVMVCESVPRTVGKSKFNFVSLFKYAINGIVAFSTVPLRLASFIGFLVLTSGFIYMIVMLFRAVFSGIAGGGFVTIVTLILFLGGIIIMLLGVIGEYIARIYMEIKKRPLYVVSDSNLNENDECETGS